MDNLRLPQLVRGDQIREPSFGDAVVDTYISGVGVPKGTTLPITMPGAGAEEVYTGVGLLGAQPASRQTIEQSLNSIRNSLSIRKTAAPKQAVGSALRLAVASQDAGAQRLRGQKLESGHEHRHEDGGHAKRRSSGEPLTLRRIKAQHRPAHRGGAADQSSPRKRCAAHVARRRRRRAGAIRTSAHATSFIQTRAST